MDTNEEATALNEKMRVGAKNSKINSIHAAILQPRSMADIIN